jgi:hypothetical protein
MRRTRTPTAALELRGAFKRNPSRLRAGTIGGMPVPTYAEQITSDFASFDFSFLEPTAAPANVLHLAG